MVKKVKKGKSRGKKRFMTKIHENGSQSRLMFEECGNKMINKKELEIELAKKGADALKSAFEINEKLERKIFELEKRVTELDVRFRRHVNNVDVHTSVQ